MTTKHATITTAPDPLNPDYLPKQKSFMECTDPELLYSGAFGAGKSFIGCEKGLFLSLKYPGNVGAIIRKNFADLKMTTMETFFRYVCPRQYISTYNKNDHKLTLTNGSVIYFIGLTAAKESEVGGSKIGSLELGWAFVDEIIEIEEDEYIMLLGRMRVPGIPIYQVFGATNPGPPSHWLYQRAFIKKEMTVFQSSTLENVKLPQAYIDRLNKMTGRHRDRYVLGQWIGFEGLVYENFNIDKHIISPIEIPDYWHRWRVIDFGYANPFVCQWWAQPPKTSGQGQTTRPYYLYREWYMSQRTVSDHAPIILRHSKGESYLATYADWDAEDRATLAQEGIKTTRARKEINAGIQEVHDCIDADELFIFEDALIQVDTSLVTKSLPTCTIDEITSYSWPSTQAKRNPKEIPIDKDNHGMDTMRYLVFSNSEHTSAGKTIHDVKVADPIMSVSRNWRGFGDRGSWRGI